MKQQVKLFQLERQLNWRWSSIEQLLEILNQINVNCSIPDNIPEDAYKNRFSDYSPLHLVAKWKNLDLANELIKRGANVVKQEAHNQRTPLRLAIGDIDYDEKVSRIGKSKSDLVDALLSAQIQADNAVNPKCSEGISHFHIACLHNHTAAIEYFMKIGESIDQVNNEGLTPLHYAIKSASFDAIKILLTSGADMNLKDKNGMSPIVLLTELMMELNDLMTIGKCVPANVYEDGIKKIESTFKLIFELKMHDPTLFDNAELTAVHVACLLKNKSTLKKYLRKGFDSNKSLPRDSKFWPGWTPLHFSACCNVESMDLLLQNGANINAKNEKGETPLELCAMRYAPRIVKKMLSRRDEFKNILFSDDSTKLLEVLHAMNSHDKLNNLLNGLLHVNISLPLDSVIWPGFSILHLSVLMNEKTKKFFSYLTSSEDEKLNCTKYEVKLYKRRIKMCLEQGCDVSMKNADGLSPIHLAFKMQKYKIANELLWFCREDAVDPNGLSHFHIACALENQKAVKRLLSKGVNINDPVKYAFEWFIVYARDGKVHYSVKAQSTPLHIAMTLANNELVHCLVENGADILAKDERGLTPIHLSIMYFTNEYQLRKLFNYSLKDCHEWKKVVSRADAGFSYLFIAAHADDDKAIESLLESGEQANVVWPRNLDFLSDNAGLTPLHIAVNVHSTGKAACALVEAGADIFAENPNREHDSPLQRAFANSKILSYFGERLRHDGMSIIPLNPSGLTQLHVACCVFHLDWAKELLNMGTDVNATMLHYTKKNGDETVLKLTPLHAMVVQVVKDVHRVPHNFMDLLQLLIEHGADVVAIDDNEITPLHLVNSKYRSILQKERLEKELYSRSDSSSDKSSDYADSQYSSLYYASQPGNIDSEGIFLGGIAYKIADLLLESQKSYDINPTTDKGFSHFHYACLRNKVDIVQKFLDNGVDVNRMTSFFADEKPGFSPLHFALFYHCKQVVSLLIESGADVKAEDADGNTPLHVAINRHYIDLQLFDKLLGLGANINAKNIAGEMPMRCFFDKAYEITMERLEFFVDRGATMNISNSDSAIKLFDVAMKKTTPNDVVSVFKKLLNLCDHIIGRNIKRTFNAIHSLVSVYDSDRTLDFYLDAVGQLMELGFEINWQDERGNTALHKASHKRVDAAVEALLILGANINIVNDADHAPLARWNVEILQDRKRFRDLYYDIQIPYARTLKNLLAHVYKMKLTRLDVLDPMTKALELAEEYKRSSGSYINGDFVDEHVCQSELIKIENSSIGQLLPVKNFLSEWGAVIDYPTMLFAQREVIDKYFMDSKGLRKEFPQFCGLLMMQYRKAVDRVELIRHAKYVMIAECEIELPDLCLEAIIQYLKNDDLRILTALGKVATQTVDPEYLGYHNECKRLASIIIEDDDDHDGQRNWYTRNQFVQMD